MKTYKYNIIGIIYCHKKLKQIEIILQSVFIVSYYRVMLFLESVNKSSGRNI